MTRTYDEAARLAGPTVTVAGREWQLPHRSAVPAKAVQSYQRLRARIVRSGQRGELDDLGDDDDVPEELLGELEHSTPLELLAAFIGPELVDEMVAAGATHGAIEELVGEYALYAEQGRGPLGNSRREGAQ